MDMNLPESHDEPLYRPETVLRDVAPWFWIAVLVVGILAAIAFSGFWPW